MNGIDRTNCNRGKDKSLEKNMSKRFELFFDHNDLVGLVFRGDK